MAMPPGVEGNNLARQFVKRELDLQMCLWIYINTNNKKYHAECSQM
jgi:hypothetical protein